MAFDFSVGWKESQNTYLLASEHVKGFINLSHKYPISNNPVPQHAVAASSNPVNKKIITY